MKIAIITAMAEETMPILNKLGNAVKQEIFPGVDVNVFDVGNDEIYLATSGVGEIKAALTVQLLKDLYNIDVVLNFGFVGALNPDLEIGEIVVCDRVCHYQFDVTQVDTDRLVGQYSGMQDNFFRLDRNIINRVRKKVPALKTVAVASGDKFVGCKSDKDALACFGCDICEMELAGLAIACERNGIPLFSAKAVSDKADESACESFSVVLQKGMSRYEELLPDILCALKD